jgi:hypothetical protein
MDEDHRRALDSATQLIQSALERGAHEQRKSDFQELDRRELSRMDDKRLAEWQAQYSRESAQYILAEHEWQRRLTAQQVAATRFAAWIGICGVVVGGFLGWLLASWHPFH